MKKMIIFFMRFCFTGYFKSQQLLGDVTSGFHHPQAGSRRGNL
jgi:hypothetical protein